MRTMIAYLTDRRGDTIALSQDERGQLFWQSDTPKLQADANRFVPLNAIPESGGNQAAWAIHKLHEYVGGDCAVVATAIRPIDKHYGIPPHPDKARYGATGEDLWADADSPERYAAKNPGIRLYIYTEGDEESSIPLCSVKEWEAFATWAAERPRTELKRLAVEGHTDAHRTTDAMTTLQGELMRLKVPDEYTGIVNKLRDAIGRKGIEGLLVSVGTGEEME